MASWACLALKPFKLHLKALKSLLSPCLIALKAFKPLLQDSKRRAARLLVPVGLWVLAAGTAGTLLPCLGGGDERAAASTSGGDRRDGPPAPRGTVCPHLQGLRAFFCPQALPSSYGAGWLEVGGACVGPVSGGSWVALDAPSKPCGYRGEKWQGYPRACPRVLGSCCGAWRGSD